MSALRWTAVVALALQARGTPDIRVAKGIKERGYNAVRVSLVDRGEGSGDAFFDYSRQFFGAWDDYHLHTTVKEVKGNATFRIGGHTIRIRIPLEGERVRGILLSDPCVSSAGGMGCQWQELFQTDERLSKVLNQFVGSDDIDFWGILGDNFYESKQAGGHVTKGFFDKLSLEAKSKPLLSVPGNHDFWIAGSPPGQAHIDQFAYGFAQMFGQDTLSSLYLHNNAPYDFSVPPSPGSIPTQENFVFNHQIGDAAFFGFSGAHSKDNLQPHITNFCQWLTNAPKINTAVILGHWNTENLGCKHGMSTPEVFEAAKVLPGCRDKDLLFMDGHDHCNRVHTNYPSHGFLIGGNGMGGNCPRQQFGFLVLDSDPKGPTVSVDYFELASLTTQDVVLHSTEALDAVKAALLGDSNSLSQDVHVGTTFVTKGVIDSFCIGLPDGKTETPKPVLRKADLPEEVEKGGAVRIQIREVSSSWDALQDCIQANPTRPYSACKGRFATPWRSGRRPPLPITPAAPHPNPLKPATPPAAPPAPVQKTEATTTIPTTSTTTTTRSLVVHKAIDLMVLDTGHPGPGAEPQEERREDRDVYRDGQQSYREASIQPTAGWVPQFPDAGDNFPWCLVVVPAVGVAAMLIGGCVAVWSADGARTSSEMDHLIEEDARETTC